MMADFWMILGFGGALCLIGWLNRLRQPVAKEVAALLSMAWITSAAWLATGSFNAAVFACSGFILWWFLRWIRAVRRVRIPVAIALRPCSLLPGAWGSAASAVERDLEREGFLRVGDLSGQYFGERYESRVFFHSSEAIEATLSPDASTCGFCSRNAEGEDWSTLTDLPGSKSGIPPYVRAQFLPVDQSTASRLAAHRAFVAKDAVQSHGVGELETICALHYKDLLARLELEIQEGGIERDEGRPETLRVTWRGVLQAVITFLRQPVRLWPSRVPPSQ